MNILIINYNDLKGGAAIAAYRLHSGLKSIGINSKMLVQQKYGDDDSVIALNSKNFIFFESIRRKLNNLIVKFLKRDNNYSFSVSWFPFSRVISHINKLKPDIVHLHWTSHGMLPVSYLKKIQQPIVWSLHDMWPFTGGCHYDNACGKYITGCFSCPALCSKKKNDLSSYEFKTKHNAYQNISNMTIIGLSSWISRCAKNSMLLKNNSIINLPNMIDTNIFAPFDMKKARDNLGLPQDKIILLFGADSLNDYQKGFNILPESLKKIIKTNIELVAFGRNQYRNQDMQTDNIHFVGEITDTYKLQMMYCSANFTLLPSLQENLSNVVMESLSCGTPVIAFDIGGNPDMIVHGVNGYLADKNKGATSFASCIDIAISATNKQCIRTNARDMILKSFNFQSLANKYMLLYAEILKNA